MTDITRADSQEGAQEKPLHVRVAKALGWAWRLSNLGPRPRVKFLCPPEYDAKHDLDPDMYEIAGEDSIQATDAYRYIPRYDTDWSATGPLIEKFLDGKRGGFHLWIGNGEWNAGRGDGYSQDWNASGPTPLLAVCELLLKLKEAGKL